MLFVVCFVFDFKACLKSYCRKIYLPRNSNILSDEKNLGIPHSLLHPLSVKSVGAGQQSESFFLWGRGCTKHIRSESFLNVEFEVWLCGRQPPPKEKQIKKSAFV